MVECLTGDRGIAGPSLICVSVLCPGARHINPCLVLVQSKKIHHDTTEELLIKIKSNERKRQNSQNKLSSPIADNIFAHFFGLRFSFLCYFLLIGIGQLDNDV